MSVTSNEIQIAERVIGHIVSMNRTLVSAANTILDGFDKLKGLTDIANKKTVLESGLESKGITLSDLQNEVTDLKAIAEYIKSNISGVVDL